MAVSCHWSAIRVTAKQTPKLALSVKVKDLIIEILHEEDAGASKLVG